MAEKTGIAWTDSTFNPWIGCTKVSPGCDHCYAEALDRRHRFGGSEHWGSGVARMRTTPAYWRKPLAWNQRAQASGKRHLVFCASLADVFDNEVPKPWRWDLFSLIQRTPSLTWLLLTKRIGNARAMLNSAAAAALDNIPGSNTWDREPWNNVWIGASIVNQEEADRDIPKLLATQAVKRFVSYEPALGPVDFPGLLYYGTESSGGVVPLRSRGLPQLDWIIVGGESNQGGAKARPFNIRWAHSAVDQCRAAGIPVFVKQLGSNVASGDPTTSGRFNFKDRSASDPAEWPMSLQIQEFPK